jgi:2-methylcitrate dehydratase PrpD
MTIAMELAKRINALRYEDLPPQAVHWAKAGILDTVGVTLAGSTDPSASIVAGVLASGNGSSLVFGTTRRVSALDAALINGSASHAHDFDDCNNTLGGHPSAPFCRRCLRSLTISAPAAASSSPPMSPVSKPNAKSPWA